MLILAVRMGQQRKSLDPDWEWNKITATIFTKGPIIDSSNDSRRRKSEKDLRQIDELPADVIMRCLTPEIVASERWRNGLP